VQTISVAIVHGSPPIREGLAELLGRQSGLRVVAVRATLAAIRETAAGADIVLCDLAAALADVSPADAAARLLVFNVSDEDRSIIDELVAGILAVAAGATPSSARVVTSLFRYVAGRRSADHPVLAPSLTGREEEILRLVAEGLSNRRIAERLGLRPQTVKNHVGRVFEKLDVHSRLELIGGLRRHRVPVLVSQSFDGAPTPP
jgi:two-component system, NarL family, nitrate/nitrite response regulator NarL